MDTFLMEKHKRKAIAKYERVAWKMHKLNMKDEQAQHYFLYSNLFSTTRLSLPHL